MLRQRRKNKSKTLTLLAFLLMIIIAAFIFKLAIFKEQQLLESKNDSIITPAPSFTIKSESNTFIPSDSLYSPNAILVCLEDNSILMKKKSEVRIYPASLTKMMTAILAIEKLPSLQEEIKLSRSIFDELYSTNASMAGFQPGEEVLAIDLLYGVLLPSGAESCIGLADYISGSEKNFVKTMNQKATELGMINTHFVNTTGLHDKNHYTTVEDLAILLNYALKNDTFRQIFTSSRYSTKPTNKHPNGIIFYSTMFEKLQDPTIKGGEIIGGKTGYTAEAGLCLASLAIDENKEYILVTVGAQGDHYSESFNIKDALLVYNSIGKE